MSKPVVLFRPDFLCELSASLVSQVERNLASPSIASLVKMAEILGCPVGTFFEENKTEQLVVRKSERRKLILPHHKQAYELATPSELDGSVRVLVVTLEPGEYSSMKKTTHQDKEICFVLHGEVEIEIDLTVHRLQDGDTLVFDSSDPHRFYNPTNCQSQFMLIVYT